MPRRCIKRKVTKRNDFDSSGSDEDYTEPTKLPPTITRGTKRKGGKN